MFLKMPLLLHLQDVFCLKFTDKQSTAQQNWINTLCLSLEDTIGYPPLFRVMIAFNPSVLSWTPPKLPWVIHLQMMLHNQVKDDSNKKCWDFSFLKDLQSVLPSFSFIESVQTVLKYNTRKAPLNTKNIIHPFKNSTNRGIPWQSST